MLDAGGREALLARLEAMPSFLERSFASLSAAESQVQGPNQTFAPVEQCWHLADLEREGFGLRIRRLLDEEAPVLADFDGARIARERRYRDRSLAEGLSAFRSARLANLEALRALGSERWSRAGTQQGVGRVMLCDLPQMMAEHDGAHRGEIEAWVADRASSAAHGGKTHGASGCG
jgi:DinB superfamily